MQLRFDRAGPTEAPRGCIVFLHGFPFDASVWKHQLDRLPPGWRALAPDLRGFGSTPIGDLPGEVSSGRKAGGGIARADEPVLTMDRLAEDVAALVHEQAAGPAVVCGLSMGGYVAFSLWRRHPELVRALVLADTRAETDSDEARENRRRTAQLTRDDGAAAAAASMLTSLLAPGTLSNAADAVGHTEAMILNTTPATLIAALAGMASRHDSTRDLAGITVPTLVLVGEHDSITPPDVARSMAEAIPGAELAILPDAGHLACLENPRAFNAALSTFLDRLP